MLAVPYRALTSGAINKSVCKPGAEIKRIIRISHNCVASAASYLISKSAVPCCSLKPHFIRPLSDLFQYYYRYACFTLTVNAKAERFYETALTKIVVSCRTQCTRTLTVYYSKLT